MLSMITKNKLTNASLSTMWAIKNFPDLNAFFQMSKTIGIQTIELNHQVNSKMLSQAGCDQYQFSSVHEPCPADIPTRDLVNQDWLISSHNETNRIKGVQTVKESVNLACKLGASVVVIHCGNVAPDQGYESSLRSLFKQGETQSTQYQRIKAEFCKARSDQAAPRLSAVKKSLNELLEYANTLNIKLGLENRYHYLDIPIIDEMEDLLNLADSSRLGFVYDVGHAQALDRLGFFQHEDWLKRFSTRLIGCHLHDVMGLTDHLAPGLGEIDFTLISKYIPKDAFRTIEILPDNTLEQLQVGLCHLLEAGCIKYLNPPTEY
jgi:sugar phosphate isomerase/epimerase